MGTREHKLIPRRAPAAPAIRASGSFSEHQAHLL